MINKILMGIFKIIISLVNLLLTPINLLISNYLPSVSNAITLIRNLFQTMFTYIGWVVDASFISADTIALIIACLTLKFTIPIAINAIKIAIKWYNNLKP